MISLITREKCSGEIVQQDIISNVMAQMLISKVWRKVCSGCKIYQTGDFFDDCFKARSEQKRQTAAFTQTETGITKSELKKKLLRSGLHKHVSSASEIGSSSDDLSEDMFDEDDAKMARKRVTLEKDMKILDIFTNAEDTFRKNLLFGRRKVNESFDKTLGNIQDETGQSLDSSPEYSDINVNRDGYESFILSIQNLDF